jgi:hypothetical protein
MKTELTELIQEKPELLRYIARGRDHHMGFQIIVPELITHCDELYITAHTYKLRDEELRGTRGDPAVAYMMSSLKAQEPDTSIRVWSKKPEISYAGHPDWDHKHALLETEVPRSEERLFVKGLVCDHDETSRLGRELGIWRDGEESLAPEEVGRRIHEIKPNLICLETMSALFPGVRDNCFTPEVIDTLDGSVTIQTRIYQIK